MKYLVVLFLCLCSLLRVSAQVCSADGKNPNDLPYNIKVLKEYNDGNGNMVKVIQYDLKHSRVVETITKPIAPAVNLARPISPDTINTDSLLIVVNKSLYIVDVYYKRKKIRAYKAVFGPKPLQDKVMEGDRCTPEGWFKVSCKNPASKYTRFMQLNYPNDSSQAHFHDLKEKGIIPRSARIGGNVGIHGVWKGGDDMIELGVGWTDGCIALRNKDIEELYALAGVGTRVYIKR